MELTEMTVEEKLCAKYEVVEGLLRDILNQDLARAERRGEDSQRLTHLEDASRAIATSVESLKRMAYWAFGAIAVATFYFEVIAN